MTECIARVSMDSRGLRAVVFRDGDQYVAQCLEVDVGAQASTLEDLADRLNATLDAEETEMLLTGRRLLPAPQVYFDMWNRS